MAVPQPDCESAEAEVVAALDVVDWAAARPATARTKADVYCIVIVDVMLSEGVLLFMKMKLEC